MNIEKEIVKGFLCLVLFFIWQFKMFLHFKFIKDSGKIDDNNYLKFLFNPFRSGFYYMVIVLPFVFFIEKEKKLKNILIVSLLIWILFIFIVSI